MEVFDENVKPKGGGNIINSATSFARDTAAAVTGKAKGFMKGIRSRTIPKDGQAEENSLSTASWAVDPNGKDWRVKLSIPPIPAFEKSKIMGRLVETGGLCFPFTPTIIMSHQASYNAITPVHSNYPFFAYQNSSVDQMTITGQFYVQNSLEGEYWLGALHYLRSITKMFYGEGSNQGAPPPVVKLNGYGDYVFKDVPVIITNFTLDMPTDVDYIAVNMAKIGEPTGETTGGPPNKNKVVTDTAGQIAYCPVESQVTVTAQPIYSRSDVEKFSLDKFAKGGYLGAGGKGFI